MTNSIEQYVLKIKITGKREKPGGFFTNPTYFVSFTALNDPSLKDEKRVSLDEYNALYVGDIQPINAYTNSGGGLYFTRRDAELAEG